MRIKIVLPIFAEAPRAKKTARMAAAAGTDIGRFAAPVPEKRSCAESSVSGYSETGQDELTMMRPIVNGMERETLEETTSCATG